MTCQLPDRSDVVQHGRSKIVGAKRHTPPEALSIQAMDETPLASAHVGAITHNDCALLPSMLTKRTVYPAVMMSLKSPMQSLNQ